MSSRVRTLYLLPLGRTTVLLCPMRATCTRGDGEAPFSQVRSVPAVPVPSRRVVATHDNPPCLRPWMFCMLACTNGDVSRLTLCCALCGCVVPGWGGLGHGDKTQQELPGLVEQLAEDGHRVTQVSCGAKHTLALTDDGTVLCWGDGEFGRLGNGNSSAPVPEVVEELAGVPCSQVRAYVCVCVCVCVCGRMTHLVRNVCVCLCVSFPRGNRWRVASLSAWLSARMATCGCGGATTRVNWGLAQT